MHSILGSLGSESLSIEKTPVEMHYGTSRKKNLSVDEPALIPLYYVCRSIEMKPKTYFCC
jgi:hypothetical protein